VANFDWLLALHD